MNEARNAFLSVCNMQRLEAIMLSKERASKFVSDFVMLAENHPQQDPRVLAKCAVEVASMNLSLLPQAGQVYIYPRSGAVNVEVGYKGWLVLAKRVGILVRCYPIFKGDDYSFSVEGFEQKFHYTPSEANLLADKTEQWVTENLKCIVVVTKDADGIETINLISRELLERLRSKGAKNSPAYKDWILEMYQAKAIKYVIRKLPIDTYTCDAFSNFVNAMKEDDKNDEAFEKIEASKVGALPLNSAFESAKVADTSYEGTAPVNAGDDGEYIDFEALLNAQTQNANQ